VEQYRKTDRKCTRLLRERALWSLKSDMANYLVEELLNLMEGCSGRRRCGLNFCPSCGPRLREQEALRSAKKLVAALGRFPRRATTSFVTILGPIVPLGCRTICPISKTFIKRIHDTCRHKLGSTRWVGHVHVPVSGRVHVHAIVAHDGIWRENLVEVLEKCFVGNRIVSVQELDKKQSVGAAIRRCLNYGAEARPYVRDKHEFGQLPNDYTRLTGLCLLSKYYLSGGKYEGLRFSINVRSGLQWKGTTLFDPMSGEIIDVSQVNDWTKRHRKPRPLVDKVAKYFEARRLARKLDGRRGIFVRPARRLPPALRSIPMTTS
jgi:hypothetical protein